ncbi:MAG: glycosyltransferase [Rhizobiales bacterium]|nr:glycosyltransferase [Hyphomicrobiales bacterium]
MSRICLYFVREPERDRWIPGDRFVRPIIRRIVRGKFRPGGIDKVFINLCLGLDRLGVPYEVNLPFDQLCDDDQVGVVGRCRLALKGYDRPNPIVGGVALMTYPSEWPTLCEEYPVVVYLQHCEWCKVCYEPFYGDRCQLWPVGIDTHSWTPTNSANKRFDFLIYDKIRWQREVLVPQLLDAVKAELTRRKLTFTEIRYGQYDEQQYKKALQDCRSMIFLCEHESQGLAYQECLASDVPVLAWDQGWCLDPERFKWGQPDIPATSVPFFDARCGLRFRDIEEFPNKLTQFLDMSRRGAFAPRDYIMENLTLEKCSADYLRILEEAQVRA